MEEKPTFAAMAMTESNAGSDTASIRATAVLDKEKNEWKAKDTTKIPTIHLGIEILRRKYLQVYVNKKSNTITIKSLIK